MAELDYGDLRAVLGAPNGKALDGAQAGAIGKIINFGGALVSMGLIAGIAVWGYELMLRDVSGVPVVRALDGPMRVQPDDPGGQLAAHQGLSVNRVQSDGIAEAVAERLVLAPTPVDLRTADQAGISPRPSQRPAPAPRGEATPMAEAGEPAALAAQSLEITAPALLTEQAPTRTLPDTITDGEGVTVALAPTDDLSETDVAVAAALALADHIAARADPLAAVADRPAGPEITVISAAIKGVSRSPRPTIRPIAPPASPGLTPVSYVPGGGSEVDPASIPAGTRLVQLGAYDTKAEARQEWDRLYGRFAAYLEDKKRVIQRAESSGRVFYRLRAVGFDDLADTRRFCSVLLAENTACIPVKVR